VTRTMPALCLLLVFSAVAFAQETATAVREADAVCARCHQDIFAKYVQTPMANASGIAMDKAIPGVLDHKGSGAVYSVAVQDRDLVLKTKQTGTERRLDYYLGSGHLGVTYLYSINGYLFESPIAWYAASQSYDMKPGLGSMTTMPPALPMQASCLRCHMSSVQPSDPGTINHYVGLPFAHTGITCEACHGDTRHHVSSGGKTPVINPAKLDAARRDSVCISCHLEGDVSVEKAGRSSLDYKPGDNISDYLSYFVYRGKNLTERGVSEVEQLSMSMCKRASGDRMSCTSCHDPHSPPAPGERAAFYRKKCLACHDDATFAASHHPENPDCTSCHMPRSSAENIPHVAWTDHRIRKVPDKVVMTDLDEGHDLVSVFSPDANQRDFAMAYFRAAMDGNSAFHSRAFHLLEEIRPQLSGDMEALTALALESERRGDYKQATDIFQQILRHNPENLTALSNLGTLRARSGDLQSAAMFLKKAFDQNEDIVGLAKNLAQVQCMMGDVALAKATLQKTMQYSPGLQDVQQMLDQLQSCPGDTKP
jgi:predicted CXXCH cytochrome family protein